MKIKWKLVNKRGLVEIVRNKKTGLKVSVNITDNDCRCVRCCLNRKNCCDGLCYEVARILGHTKINKIYFTKTYVKSYSSRK